jgi:hypothetical protein
MPLYSKIWVFFWIYEKYRSFLFELPESLLKMSNGIVIPPQQAFASGRDIERFKLLCVRRTRKMYDASVLLPGSSAVVANPFVKKCACIRSMQMTE